MTHIVAGNKAPGFSLKSLDNKEYSLNTLLERGPVVAAFFKISCPVCQFTFPFLERLYKQYGDDRVTFLGISQDDARATKDFAREYAVTSGKVTAYSLAKSLVARASSCEMPRNVTRS